ncbi:hypothetical protein GCM10027447_27350 [Glycomyces halotolerans]
MTLATDPAEAPDGFEAAAAELAAGGVAVFIVCAHSEWKRTRTDSDNQLMTRRYYARS